MTSGLEMEWDYSGRKGRDGQKKKISKANEKRVRPTVSATNTQAKESSFRQYMTYRDILRVY